MLDTGRFHHRGAQGASGGGGGGRPSSGVWGVGFRV